MKWLMLSIALVASTPAYADTSRGMGVGVTASCGKWLQDREKKDYSSMGNWASGFLTGVDFVTGNKVLEKTDGAGVFYWLDNYCRTNPTNVFGDAVQEFYLAHAKKP